MNAAHPASQDRQAEQRANEPSMDEILASIRRIIADDQAFTGRGTSTASLDDDRAASDPWASEPAAPIFHRPAPSVPPPLPSVHYPAAPAAEPQARADLGVPRAAMEEPLAPRSAPKLAAVPEPTRPASALPELAPETPLVSSKTDAAVGNAFSALVASQFMRESEMLPDLVREMLRPMLKMWLDDNLPVIVERLVRVEIERVARGSR